MFWHEVMVGIGTFFFFLTWFLKTATKKQSLKVIQVKITSDVCLYTLYVTSWKGHLKSCLKLNQTGRLPADPDTDALYYTVIVKCWAGLERVTRSLPKLAALQLVCNDGGGAWKLWGNSKRHGGSSFCPPVRRVLSTPAWDCRNTNLLNTTMTQLGQEGFPLSFYAICSLSTQSVNFLCNLLKIKYD